MRSNKRVLIIIRWIIFIGIVALIAWAAVGCSNKGTDEKKASEAEKQAPPVVAKVGDSTITGEEFKQYLFQRPISSSGSVEAEVEKRLDELVLAEVLYQEALSMKLGRDPEVRSRIRQMLTQKLIDDQLNRKILMREIEEKELLDYYEKNRGKYNRPAQVRLADIFISIPAGATEEERNEGRRKAENVFKEALIAKKKRTGFGALVEAYSDTPTNYGKGDTGFFDVEGKPAGIEPKLAEAAFKLKRVGSMTDHVVETPNGYHVIMLIGKRSAIQRPFEELREQLKQQLVRETLTQAREDYFKKIRENATVKIDNQVFSGILEEIRSKAGTNRSLSTRNKTSVPRKKENVPMPPPQENK